MKKIFRGSAAADSYVKKSFATKTKKPNASITRPPLMGFADEAKERRLGCMRSSAALVSSTIANAELGCLLMQFRTVIDLIHSIALCHHDGRKCLVELCLRHLIHADTFHRDAERFIIGERLDVLGLEGKSAAATVSGSRDSDLFVDNRGQSW